MKTGSTEMHTVKLTGTVGDDRFSIRQVTDIPPGPVRILIESAGGCLISAIAIYRLLIENPDPVTTQIIYAGSAATLVAMGGGRRLINGDGYFFLHRTWDVVIGTANTLRKCLAQQEEWDAAIAVIYQDRTGLSLERVYELMDGETMLSATQALTLGFVDEILGEPQDVVHSTTSERTALGCLKIEDRMSKPTMTQLRNQARPVAMLAPSLNKPAIPLPAIPAGGEGAALESFVEAERREVGIRQGIAARLRRVINQGGHITWPLRVTWTCSMCSQTNYGPPAQNRLAKPCAYCAQTSLEETQ